MIYVVGIGPGNPELLTRKAVEIFEKSEIIIGGKRNIEIFMDLNSTKFNFAERKHTNVKVDKYDNKKTYEKEYFYLESNFGLLCDYISSNIEKSITVLASGDPKVYGISDYISRNFSGKTEIEVVSGISSIQYAFSKLDINMNDLYITSSHGRSPDFDFIFLHDKVAMVTDKKIGPREICREIISRKLNYYVYICENLSYDDEKIHEGSACDFINDEKYDLAVVILIKEVR